MWEGDGIEETIFNRTETCFLALTILFWYHLNDVSWAKSGTFPQIFRLKKESNKKIFEEYFKSYFKSSYSGYKQDKTKFI